MKMKTRVSLTTVAVLLFVSTLSLEGAFIRPVDATASSSYNDTNVDEDRLRDPSGTAGVDTLSAEAVDATHPENSGTDSFGQWHSGDNDVADGAWVRFEVEDYIAVSNLYIWQANQTDNFNRGVNEFTVDVSLNGSVWTDALGTNNLTISTGGNISAQPFELTGIYTCKFVRVNIISSHGSSYVGLSEVRLGGTALANDFLGGNFESASNWRIGLPGTGYPGVVGVDGTMTVSDHENWGTVTFTNGTITRTGDYKVRNTTWIVNGGTQTATAGIFFRGGADITVDGGTVNSDAMMQMEPDNARFLSGTVNADDYLYFRNSVRTYVHDANMNLGDIRFFSHDGDNGYFNFLSGGSGTLTMPGNRVSFLESLIEGTNDPLDPRRKPVIYQGGVIDFGGGPYPVNIKLDDRAVSANDFLIDYDANSDETTLKVAPGAPALVGHWTFDQDGTDSTVSSNDAQFAGSAAVTQVAGQSMIGGGALMVPGTSSNHVYISDNGLPTGGLPSELYLPNSYTVVGWAWRDPTDDNNSFIFTQGYWQEGFSFGYTTMTKPVNPKYVMGRVQDVRDGLIMEDPEPTEGEWFFVAITFNREQIDDNQMIYIDGEFRNSNDRSNNYAATLAKPMGIGVENCGSNTGYKGRNWWKGYIDDVAVWNGMLGAGDIRALYNLATTEGLNYNASQAQSLFKLYSGGDTGAKFQINGKVWQYATGLIAANDGDVNTSGQYELVMDADAETGLITVASGTLVIIN